jgi:hypothetical protein
MATLIEKTLDFAGKAFGEGVFSIGDAYQSLPKISLQVRASLEVRRFRFQDYPGTLVAVAGTTNATQIFSLAHQLQDFPQPLIFALESVDKVTPGLLVAHRIAHIIPGHCIFAPELGILYKRVAERRVQVRTHQASQLSATGRQVVSCAILVPGDQWTGALKPKDLRVTLQKLLPDASLSPASLTRVLSELKDLDFGYFEGGGPHKRFHFHERDALWRQLFRVETETVIQRVRINVLPKHVVFAGNQALARVAPLRLDKNEPIEIAMSQKEFALGLHSKVYSEASHIIVQIWRNRPALLIEKNGEFCLNIIDIALSKRSSVDSREREVIAEMLRHHQLNPASFLEEA